MCKFTLHRDRAKFIGIFSIWFHRRENWNGKNPHPELALYDFAHKSDGLLHCSDVFFIFLPVLLIYCYWCERQVRGNIGWNAFWCTFYLHIILLKVFVECVNIGVPSWHLFIFSFLYNSSGAAHARTRRKSLCKWQSKQDSRKYHPKMFERIRIPLLSFQNKQREWRQRQKQAKYARLA